jgi:poly-gamma-glutamate capsule biosynthesis protein CapA/YwtB (metallophosphatase superfamily)
MTDEMIDDMVCNPQSPGAVSLLLAGDLVLDVEDPDHWLSGIAPAIRAADLAIGHLEVPHTRRGAELQGDVPAPGAPPENLDALARAGFDAVTLAGNHIADCGAEGIADTLAGLDRLNILHTGAGASLALAGRPAWLQCKGRQVALLSYNCVGPESAWATETRAGCNYLRVATADGAPVAPAAALRQVTPDALAQLKEDIGAARAAADLVIVAFHKGIVHTPAQLAPYEQALARAAIDAGADVVVGHHAHIIRGVERHGRGAIFHGLGNGCVVTRALRPQQEHAARAAWAQRRRTLFGFEPDPAYELAPFHPEAVNAMLGLIRWHADGRLDIGMIPVFVEPPGRPVLASGNVAEKIVDYMRRISETAGLPAVRLEPREGAWVLQ